MTRPIPQVFESRSANQHHVRTKKIFDPVKKAISDAFELALKQLISVKQLVLMPEANFRSGGYAIMMEDNPYQKPIKKKNICTCGVPIENLFPRTTENVEPLERFLGNLHGIYRFCTFFVGSMKTDSCLDRQQIGFTFLLDKRTYAFVERLRFYVAV